MVALSMMYFKYVCFIVFGFLQQSISCRDFRGYGSCFFPFCYSSQIFHTHSVDICKDRLPKYYISKYMQSSGRDVFWGSITPFALKGGTKLRTHLSRQKRPLNRESNTLFSSKKQDSSKLYNLSYIYIYMNIYCSLYIRYWVTTSKQTTKQHSLPGKKFLISKYTQPLPSNPFANKHVPAKTIRVQQWTVFSTWSVPRCYKQGISLEVSHRSSEWTAVVEGAINNRAWFVVLSLDWQRPLYILYIHTYIHTLHIYIRLITCKM
jgi:hypothetical protein